MAKTPAAAPQFCDSCQSAIADDHDGRVNRLVIGYGDRSILLCARCAGLVVAVLADLHLSPPLRIID